MPAPPLLQLGAPERRSSQQQEQEAEAERQERVVGRQEIEQEAERQEQEVERQERVVGRREIEQEAEQQEQEAEVEHPFEAEGEGDPLEPGEGGVSREGNPSKPEEEQGDVDRPLPLVREVDGPLLATLELRPCTARALWRAQAGPSPAVAATSLPPARDR